MEKRKLTVYAGSGNKNRELNNRRPSQRHIEAVSLKKIYCFFLRPCLANPQVVRGRWQRKIKKNPKFPAYFALYGFVGNKGKFPNISVHSALRGVVGTEREIECQICQKSFSNRSRERKETCLKPFSNRVSGSERNEGKSPVSTLQTTYGQHLWKHGE